MADLVHTQQIIGSLLTEAADCFKPGARLTLLVRNPTVLGDADFVMTNDTLPEAIAALQRREAANG